MPLRAVLEAAADADDAHRQLVQHGPVADELVGRSVAKVAIE